MNLLLLVYDCLRLDYWRDHMPLAHAEMTGRGWSHLQNHWAVAHCSDPNFSTLLTGDPPWETGITTQMGKQFKQVSKDLLGLVLKENGFATWAIQPVKVPKFYHSFEKIAWHAGTDSADLDLQAIKTFTKEAEGRQWFGFIRDMTAHYPYLELAMPPRGVAGEIRPQYEQAVAHVDAHCSRVLQFMKEEHPATIIIVCADHGELLGEHDEYDHLHTLYNYLVRVPMVVYVPNSRYKETDARTQHTDVWQTVLDLFRIRTQPGQFRKGESFARWLTRGGRGRIRHGRTLQFQGIGAGPVDEIHQQKGGASIDPDVGRMLWRHQGVVRGDHKLVINVHAGGENTFVLSRADDYAELDEPMPSKPVRTTLMRSLPGVPQYHDWEKQILRQGEDEIILERLKALGYA